MMRIKVFLHTLSLAALLSSAMGAGVSHAQGASRAQLERPETAAASLDRQAELIFWQSVARADTREMYEGYLQKFGEAGEFSIIAQQRIKELSKSTQPFDAPLANAARPDLLAANCDRLAMSPFALSRPSEIVGVEEPDPAEAVPACEAALRASPSNGRLEYDLGRAYWSSRKYPEAIRVWEQATRNGNKDAFYELGMASYKGEGVPQDYARAAALFKRAAEDNVSGGMVALGSMYDRGVFVQKDYAHARALYEQAIQLGSRGGLRNMGLLYYNGFGVRKDLSIARDYLERAAKQGDPTSIKLLADLSNKSGRVVARPQQVAFHSRGVHCPVGSTGGNTAWLVRGMPLNNFHTNNRGQIVAGAPTRCN